MSKNILERLLELHEANGISSGDICKGSINCASLSCEECPLDTRVSVTNEIRDLIAVIGKGGCVDE